MARYWYDTEFLEDGRRIELISIGIVCEDGREYYAVNHDAPWDDIAKNRWLCDNVVVSLPLIDGVKQPMPYGESGKHMFNIDRRDACVKPKWVIANEVRDFLTAAPEVELWAWYGAFDHLCLAWLYGPMQKLPTKIPMYTNDLKQEAHRLGLTDSDLPEQPDGVHNALADARHNKVRHDWLIAYERDHRP